MILRTVFRTIIFSGVFLSFLFLSANPVSACTFDVTITGTHVDIIMRTYDVAVVQYIRQSGSALVVGSEGPNIGKPWNYKDDPFCNIWSPNTWACRQNRGSGLGDGFFFADDLDGTHFSPLSNDAYGLDFNSPPALSSIGIMDGTWKYCTKAQSPSPSPTLSPTPTPSPSPTLSPTPAPTPSPTPIPVTKVFVIPGMGASWNVDAFINCKNSGYTGDWTLAPYAKSVYEELMTQLPNQGWNAIPFYYDWRQDIRKNIPLLTDLINTNTINGEKIDLVGHSMGGLIGRNYLESQNGGKASKFLAVGAPNQGSALSYPALIDGDIWMDDLTEKIATTLFFKHCGIPESFRNLLPTYNYLRDTSTKQLKDVSALSNQNSYLPTNFANSFWGVKVGTLSGTGLSTLKIIDIIKSSKFPDGKPWAKENVNEGDGTVLIESAQIPGAYSNETINQSHGGIIASTEGVNKVLQFLGSPGIADPPFVEPKSALVLIGYPGNFWITDKNGFTTQSENGMISIMDPNDGSYQLQIVPTSTNTTFIASQFLPNGKTFYHEYKLKGLVQEPKIIEFDSKHPSENILRNIREYENPRFPKFWWNFWKYWNKFHK